MSPNMSERESLEVGEEIAGNLLGIFQHTHTQQLR